MDNRFWFSMKRLSLLAALAACLASADHTGTGTSPGSGTGSGSGSAPPPYDASVACSEAIGSNMECVLNLRFTLGEYHVPGATTVAQCKAQTIGMGCDMMQHGASPSVRSSELLPRSLIVHSPLSRALSLSLSIPRSPCPRKVSTRETSRTLRNATVSTTMVKRGLPPPRKCRGALAGLPGRHPGRRAQPPQALRQPRRPLSPNAQICARTR